MEPAIYNAMISACNILEKQAIVANNLANSSTPGFKSQFDRIIINNLINKKEIPNHIQNISNNLRYDLSTGPLNYTEKSLNVAIKDDGWFVIKNQLRSREAYTRNGNFNTDAQGRLVLNGNFVVGKKGPIIIPKNAIPSISKDGVVSVIEKNENITNQRKIGQLKLVRLKNSEILHDLDGFFHLNTSGIEKWGDYVPHDSNIELIPKSLEGSNVNSAEQLIEIINNARNFDMAMKTISIYNENEKHANQLININN